MNCDNPADFIQLLIRLLLGTLFISPGLETQRPERWTEPGSPGRPEVSLPTNPVRVESTGTPKPPAPTVGWKYDREVSWYGPGFYGKRTACGLAYTKTILGVAHRSLPCGTLVTFRWNGKTATVPIIDRGPYVEGRTWDLSGGLCVYLKHCFTGPIEWKMK